MQPLLLNNKMLICAEIEIMLCDLCIKVAVQAL